MPIVVDEVQWLAKLAGPGCAIAETELVLDAIPGTHDDLAAHVKPRLGSCGNLLNAVASVEASGLLIKDVAAVR